MAQDTFGQIWNRLLLYAPGIPVPLAQQFVKNAYQECVGYHDWSELKADAEMVIMTPYSTGTATLVQAATTASMTGFSWSDSYQYKTIKMSTTDAQPYYTIITGTDDQLTFDRAYEGASDTDASFSIGDYYVEFNSDLFTLDDIRDLTAGWRLMRQRHQQNYIDVIDPKRTSSGTPQFYAAAPPRVTSGVSYPRYEFYPVIPAASHIVYRYTKTSELSANSDRPIPGISADTILAGALAELALWPGLPDRPNPFFSAETHALYKKQFEDKLHGDEMADLEKSQRMIVEDDISKGFPVDAEWMMTHGIPY